MSRIYVGDIGTDFCIFLEDEDGVVLPLADATTKEIVFLKPDGTKLTKAASFVTDGSDGGIYYRTVAGDIDQAETWKIQAHVVLPSGEWHSEIDKFSVFGNL